MRERKQGRKKRGKEREGVKEKDRKIKWKIKRNQIESENEKYLS